MDLRDSFKQGKFREYVESQPFNELFLEYEKFVAESSGKSKTFAYWSMYLKMAGKKCFLIVILLDLVRTSAKIQNHDLVAFTRSL